MSPRRYFGWEPREFHEPEYALVTWWKPWTWHRVVGVTVTREAEYSALDRALLEAHREEIADLGPHGIPMSEATDPKNQNAFIGSDKPTTDWAAKAIGDAQDAYYEAYPKASKHGHIWRVKRRAVKNTG